MIAISGKPFKLHFLRASIPGEILPNMREYDTAYVGNYFPSTGIDRKTFSIQQSFPLSQTCINYCIVFPKCFDDKVRDKSKNLFELNSLPLKRRKRSFKSPAIAYIIQKSFMANLRILSKFAQNFKKFKIGKGSVIVTRKSSPLKLSRYRRSILRDAREFEDSRREEVSRNGALVEEVPADSNFPTTI